MTQAPGKFRSTDFWSALLSGYSFIGLNTLLQIALVPLYLHSLGKTQFGLLMILLSAINFLTFGIHGLTGNVLRTLTAHASAGRLDDFARSYSRARLLFGLYSIAVSSCAAAAFLLFHDDVRLGADLDTATGLAVLFAGAQVILNADLGVVRLALSALQRQAAANFLQILGLLLFTAILLPWLYSGGGIVGVLGALFFGNLFARICAAVYIRAAKLPIRWTLERKPLQHAAAEYLQRIGLVYLAYGAIFVISQSDTFIIGWLTDADTAAEFVLLWRIPEALILLLSRIPEHAQIGFAYLHHAGRGPEFTRFCSRVAFWLQVLAFGAAATYGLFGSWIVGLWVGEAAAPKDPWGIALAGGAIFWLAYARLPAAFANMQGLRHITRLTRIAGAELALKLLIVLSFIAHFHEISPMLAINIVHGFAFYYIYRRFLKSLTVSPAQ